MVAVARFFCPALPESVQAVMAELAGEGIVPTSLETEADIALYPAGFTPPPSAAAVVLQEAVAGQSHADFLLPPGIPVAFFRNAMTQALRLLQHRREAERLQQRLQHQQQQFERLMQIGLALSAEQDHQALLSLILREARHFASCDAASIFLIEEHKDKTAELVFKLTQNDSVTVNFSEQRFPLDQASLAGYAAISGDVLNFPDVYRIPADAPYRFNPAFDQQIGYRSRSMLVIPMRTHDGRIVGVIQFLNRKRDPGVKLISRSLCEQETLPFDEPLVTLLETMASQAAVAIENNLLIERINQLFEGFVRASVHAIEQRDPTTSGHSFRVAELTVALAEATDQSRLPALNTIRFSPVQLRELRYAALLHDFGKVGVREHVLVKAKKLTPEGWLTFQYRMDLQEERTRNQFLSKRLQLLRDGQLSNDAEEKLLSEEQQVLQRLNEMRQAVTLANEPSVLDDGTFEHLQEIRQQRFMERSGHSVPLLDEHDFLALAVRRGSLTAEERLEIESHVKHTIRFLATIPWTPELSHIPAIAGAHHEKLDGSGYPHGLTGDAIPPGAKIMAVCDIFDALTASDRPYKPALPVERALSILEAEAAAGKIDKAMVGIFTTLPLTAILPTLKAL